MSATIVAQVASVVPPLVAGAARVGQVGTLGAGARLSARVVLLPVSLAPHAVTVAATAGAAATLLASPSPAPRIRFLAAPGATAAAGGTQRSTLSGACTTGPIPRALQTGVLVASSALALPPSFALPVPRRTLAAGGLLARSGAATAAQATWMIAGVDPLRDGAAGTQQTTLGGSARVVVPLAGTAALTGTRTLLAGRTQVAHPLVFWASPSAALRVRGTAASVLSGRPLLRGGGPVRARFAARARALAFRATGRAAARVFVAPARALVFRSARRAGGGGAVAMQPAQLGAPYTLRTGEQNQKVVADFSGAALAAGESIVAVAVTIMGRPLPGGRAVDVTQTMTGSASPAPCTLAGSTAICYVSNPPVDYGFVFYFYATTDSSPPRVIEEYSPTIVNDTAL